MSSKNKISLNAPCYTVEFSVLLLRIVLVYKYTFRHNANKLEMVWVSGDRKLASKLEYHIKKLPKIKKENLIKSPNLLKKYLGDKIDSEEYKVYER